MKCRATSTLFAAVLYVVVNKQRIVEDLDRDRGSESVLKPSSKHTGRRNAYARTHHLAASMWIIDHEIVKIAARFPDWQIILQRRTNDGAVLIQHRRHEIGCRTIAHFERGTAVECPCAIRMLRVPHVSPDLGSTITPEYAPDGCRFGIL